MAKIIIYTLTEQRDTVVDERIAKHLRGFGYEALVRNFAMGGTDSVIFEKPDVVVMPMIGSEQKLDFAKKCHGWGITVIVRRGEAGATKEVLDTMEAERQKVILGNYRYASVVDLELVWGQQFATVLAAHGKIKRDKIKACGAFTLDGCFDYEPRINPAKEKSLLFATGFSAADDEPEYTECGLPTDSPLQKQMYRQHRVCRDQWLSTLRDLYLRYSWKYRLVLKVRPGESPKEYRRKLGKMVNVLDYDVPSAQAIAQCDCVIHSGSTMAMEAHLLGVPSLNYTNINPDHRLAQVAPQCQHHSELLERLGQLKWNESNADLEAVEWLVKNLYGRVDGRACQRAARAIHELVKPGKRGRPKQPPQIPDQWPYHGEYVTEYTRTEPAEGFQRIMCLACKGQFYVADEAPWIFCPHCCMTMRKIVRPAHVQRH